MTGSTSRVTPTFLVSNQSAEAVYFRVDGVDPVLGADENGVILAGSIRWVGAPASGEIRMRNLGREMRQELMDEAAVSHEALLEEQQDHIRSLSMYCY